MALENSNEVNEVEDKVLLFTTKFPQFDDADLDDFIEVNEGIYDFGEMTHDEIRSSEYFYKSVSEDIFEDLKYVQGLLNGVPVRAVLKIADLGFWNGRGDGHALVKTQELGTEVFNVGSDIQDISVYIEDNELVVYTYHHDSYHKIIYRGVHLKDFDNLKEVLDASQWGGSENQKARVQNWIRDKSRSLEPRVRVELKYLIPKEAK